MLNPVLIALLLVKVLFLFVSSAQNRLTSVIAQQNLMSGQISAVWNTFLNGCGIVALLAGAYFTRSLEAWRSTQAAFHAIFLLSFCYLGRYYPLRVLSAQERFRQHSNRTRPFSQPTRRHPKIDQSSPRIPGLVHLAFVELPARIGHFFVLLSPKHDSFGRCSFQGNGMRSTQHLSSQLLFCSVSFAARSHFETSFWARPTAIPQWAPLLFIHSVNGALIVSVPIGLLGSTRRPAIWL